MPRVVNVEEFERWDIRKAKGKAKTAARRSTDVPGPETPRVTRKHLLKPDKAVEEPSNQSATEETGEAWPSDPPLPTTGESSPQRIPLPVSPKCWFAEVMTKPVKAKEEAEATDSEDESSPLKIPPPDGSKDAAGISTTKAVEKAKKSGGLERSMQVPKASDEEKREKPLSRLEAAEVAERVEKEEWFKKSRETKEKTQEGEGFKGEGFKREGALGYIVDDIPPT